MDLGLYNKSTEPRGAQGTLIGNWVEERALREATGRTRHVPGSHGVPSLVDTSQRTIRHDANVDSAHPRSIEKMSMSRSFHGRPDYESAAAAVGRDLRPDLIYLRAPHHWLHTGPPQPGDIVTASASRSLSASAQFTPQGTRIPNASQIDLSHGDPSAAVPSPSLAATRAIAPELAASARIAARPPADFRYTSSSQSAFIPSLSSMSAPLPSQTTSQPSYAALAATRGIPTAAPLTAAGHAMATSSVYAPYRSTSQYPPGVGAPVYGSGRFTMDGQWRSTQHVPVTQLATAPSLQHRVPPPHEQLY